MPQSFSFPPIDKALTHPNGLLTQGGKLDTTTLINAYSQGIFPWYDEGQPVLWWSPNPRAIIAPSTFAPARSLLKTMRKKNWSLTVNKAFPDVVRHCAKTREHSEGTWITDEMYQAYIDLHIEGYAHSIEVWEQDSPLKKRLIGGIYGVGIGTVFSGESMFHLETDASKVALAACCQHLLTTGWHLLDCQIPNPHLDSLGALLISRKDYATILSDGILDTGGLKPTARQWAELDWSNTAELEQSFR